MTNKKVFVAALASLMTVSTLATEHRVSSVAELESAASSAEKGDVILISSSGSPYKLDSTVQINKQDVAIRGVKPDFETPADPSEVVLDGQGLCRILYISTSGSRIESITFANGCANDGENGAGLRFYSAQSVVSNCVFTCCTNATSGGGAIGFRGNGANVVYDSRFDHNAATAGGAVYDYKNQSTNSFFNCQFITNATLAATAAHGGAIHSVLGVVSNCVFRGNVVPPKTVNLAGCIFGSGKEPKIIDCVFEGNRAGSASVMYLTASDVEMIRCTFDRNVADVDNESKRGVSGGVIYAGAGVSRLEDCDFLTNVVVNTGMSDTGQNIGGVLCGAVREMSNCRFVGNRGAGRGGAWYIRLGDAAYGCSKVTGTLFEDNRMTCERNDSYSGGAVYQYTDPVFVVFSNCQFRANADYTVSENKSINIQGGGGAVYAQPSSRFEDCLFEGNVTLNRGSAIYGGVTGGVYRCTFAGNRAHHPAKGIVDNLEGETEGTTAYMACGTVCLSTVPDDGWCEIADCVFTNNVVFGLSGSAVYQEIGSLRMARCSVVDNLLTNSVDGTAAFNYGAAVYFCNNTKNATDRSSDIEMDRCVFVGNRGTGMTTANNSYVRGTLQLYSRHTEGTGGTAHFGGWVRNTLFARNAMHDLNPNMPQGRSQGGAVFVSNHPIAIENCTFADNACDGNGDGVFAVGNSVSVSNCIFADDSIVNATQSNNITDVDPCFTDRANGDYTILKSSPAHDTGIALAWHGGAVDLAGNPRVIDTAVDIGCYEYRGKPGLFVIVR